jgi:hypothetical protein
MAWMPHDTPNFNTCQKVLPKAGGQLITMAGNILIAGLGGFFVRLFGYSIKCAAAQRFSRWHGLRLENFCEADGGRTTS